jgi:hypothetical protein
MRSSFADGALTRINVQDIGLVFGGVIFLVWFPWRFLFMLMTFWEHSPQGVNTLAVDWALVFRLDALANFWIAHLVVLKLTRTFHTAEKNFFTFLQLYLVGFDLGFDHIEFLLLLLNLKKSEQIWMVI